MFFRVNWVALGRLELGLGRQALRAIVYNGRYGWVRDVCFESVASWSSLTRKRREHKPKKRLWVTPRAGRVQGAFGCEYLSCTDWQSGGSDWGAREMGKAAELCIAFREKPYAYRISLPARVDVVLYLIL